MAFLGYFPKLRRGFGKFRFYTFFLRYQTKCVIKFLFRQLMMSLALSFIFDHLLIQWPTGKKEEKTEIQKFEYLENEKTFKPYNSGTIDDINIKLGPVNKLDERNKTTTKIAIT